MLYNAMLWIYLNFLILNFILHIFIILHLRIDYEKLKDNFVPQLIHVYFIDVAMLLKIITCCVKIAS